MAREWTSLKLDPRYRTAVEGIVVPLYRELVLEAPDALRRQLGNTITALVWVELRAELELALLGLERRIARGGVGLIIDSGVRDIRDSYALTLRTWRERFFERLDEVRAMGFDDRFIRMWDYYLSISEAGFRTGMTQDLQIALAKSRGRA